MLVFSFLITQKTPIDHFKLFSIADKHKLNLYQQISFKCFKKEKNGITKSTFIKQTAEGTITWKYLTGI